MISFKIIILINLIVTTTHNVNPVSDILYSKRTRDFWSYVTLHVHGSWMFHFLTVCIPNPHQNGTPITEINKQ